MMVSNYDDIDWVYLNKRASQKRVIVMTLHTAVQKSENENR